MSTRANYGQFNQPQLAAVMRDLCRSGLVLAALSLVALVVQIAEAVDTQTTRVTSFGIHVLADAELGNEGAPVDLNNKSAPADCRVVWFAVHDSCYEVMTKNHRGVVRTREDGILEAATFVCKSDIAFPDIRSATSVRLGGSRAALRVSLHDESEETMRQFTITNRDRSMVCVVGGEIRAVTAITSILGKQFMLPLDSEKDEDVLAIVEALRLDDAHANERTISDAAGTETDAHVARDMGIVVAVSCVIAGLAWFASIWRTAKARWPFILTSVLLACLLGVYHFGVGLDGNASSKDSFPEFVVWERSVQFDVVAGLAGGVIAVLACLTCWALVRLVEVTVEGVVQHGGEPSKP